MEGIISRSTTPDLPDQAARPRRTAGIGKVLLGGVAGVLLTAVLLTVLWRPRTEVTYRSTAPSAVAYEDGSPHFLGLVHEHGLSGRHSYRMVIGRDSGLSYGHWVDVDPALGAQGIASTTWTESGVRVRFPTGHEVFVPARFFLHGR
ncbi:hypothetical protein ACFWUZ_22150 [Streptomyces sp. NPDC058646]|uniref:hypothetical protein n=1 Tax=Streptomyces sp. NPDC058646 TaxID=3346574 RepID=UPI0036621A74